jgi:hypothetical protein
LALAFNEHPYFKVQIMIRSVFVMVLLFLVSTALVAQEKKKKIARPDIPGAFIVDFGFSHGRNTPANFATGLFGSRTFNVYYTYPVRFGKSKFSLVPGAGLGLDRFKLTDDYTLNSTKDPDGTFSLVVANTLYPGTYKSMIVANYFDIPVGFRFDTNPDDVSRSLNFTAGGRFGVLYDGFTKVKYNVDNEIKTIKDKQNHGLNPIRFGVYGRLGVGGFNFFTNFNLTPYFAKGKGPQSTGMTTFTVGISLSGL